MACLADTGLTEATSHGKWPTRGFLFTEHARPGASRPGQSSEGTVGPACLQSHKHPPGHCLRNFFPIALYQDGAMGSLVPFAGPQVQEEWDVHLHEAETNQLSYMQERAGPTS